MRVSGRDLVRRPVAFASTLGLAAAALTAAVVWPTSTSAGGSARLSVLANDVDVLTSDEQDAAPAQPGQLLGVGDTVRTDPTGEAEIRYQDGSVTHLGSSTMFTLVELADAPPRTRARLDIGRAWHRVQDLLFEGGGLFEVLTDAGVAGVRGTTFVTACDTETCRVLVVDGAVDVRTTSGAFLDLVEGEAVVISRRTGEVERVETVGLADPDLAFANGVTAPTLALEAPSTTPAPERRAPAADILERTVPEEPPAATATGGGGTSGEGGGAPAGDQPSAVVDDDRDEVEEEADRRPGRRRARGHEPDRGHDHDDGNVGHSHDGHDPHHHDEGA